MDTRNILTLLIQCLHGAGWSSIYLDSLTVTDNEGDAFPRADPTTDSWSHPVVDPSQQPFLREQLKYIFII